MIISAISLTFILVASSPNEMMESAQMSIAKQDWEDAASTLDALVSSIDDPSAIVHYDRGIAHYNLEQFDVAAKAFENAMVSSDDPTIASYSAYNFGNAIYQSTMRALEGTTSEGETKEAIIALEDAKAQMKETIASYRRAIISDPKDMDARANGELAWKMLQQLNLMQEQMEQQQEQQQQEDQNKQQQDEESAKEQADNQQNKEQGDSEREEQREEQEKSDQSQSQDKGEESQDDQENQVSDSSDQQEGEQSDSKDQQENESSDSTDQQEGKQSDTKNQQENKPSDTEDQQDGKQTPSEQKSQQDQSDAGQHTDEQQNEKKELPNIEEGELESTQNEKSGEPSQLNKKEEGHRLTRNEAARLLQLIRDKEQQRRKLLAARKAARRVPVQKDW